MENFIEDILFQLIEEAIDLQENIDGEFDKGKLFGYYFAISKILNQVEAFGFAHKLSDSLRNYNPESLIKNLD